MSPENFVLTANGESILMECIKCYWQEDLNLCWGLHDIVALGNSHYCDLEKK